MRHGYPDLIVVGAGVLGAFHAYFAARRGWSVLLLDRDSRPARASTRTLGALSRAGVFATDPWPAYAEATRAIYHELAAEGDITLRASGGMVLAHSEAQAQVLAELAALPGWAPFCRYLEAERDLTPYGWLRPGRSKGALLFPDDLSLDPRALLSRLLERWIIAGLLRYRPCTNVVGVTAGGLHATVHTADGAAFHAERVLVCSGANFRTLFPSRLRASGLRLSKLQLLRTVPYQPGLLPYTVLGGSTIRHMPAFRACPSFPLLQNEPQERHVPGAELQLSMRQSDDGSVVIGYSREEFSLDEAGAHEERVRHDLLAAMLGAARRTLRLPGWSVAEVWNSYALTHPDQPIVSLALDGRTQLITGLGMGGMAVAPGYAQANVQSWR